MDHIRAFMERNYRHFNARETREAAVAYDTHVTDGGKMLLAMAGAMSTGELGVSLARMIRERKVHAISCTGANLEEDVFNLLAHEEYETVPDWRSLTAEEESGFHRRGMNRVTDTCIPADVIRHLEGLLLERWRNACATGVGKSPWGFITDILKNRELEAHYQIDPSDSWVLAAMKAEIPVYSPGWEDSTMGNIFAASVISGALPHHRCVKSGTEQFQDLIEWYLRNEGRKEGLPAPGFFQIGGGIAGDFAICAVPCIIQDLKRDTPPWGYFAQITDATASFGGYSGAVPNEKITWGKLSKDTPRFSIHSDASIVAPLIFSYVLGE